jgi:DNA adenine methylase
MARLRSPSCWFGGKGQMTAKLLPLTLDCRRYVEPFGGGASVLLAREPVDVEVYNDIDGNLHEFFCVLADPRKFKR